MAQEHAHRQWHRSQDAYLAGVCAGIAECYDMDAISVRILFILLTLVTCGFALLVYVAFGFLLPRAADSAPLYDVMPEQAESNAFGHLDCAQLSDPMLDRQSSGSNLVIRLGVAVAIMILFMVIAINATSLVVGASWWQFWPTICLMAGLCLTIVPVGVGRKAAWHAFGIVLMSTAAMALPMSLGVIGWETIPYALSRLWPLIVVAVAMAAVGSMRGIDALVVGGALCVTAFCLAALALYALPGSADALMVLMPDGNVLRIAILPE